MAKGKAVVRRNREYWAEVVADFEKSALKHGEFCEQRGLEAGTFRHWLYHLRREAKGEVATQSRFVTVRPTIATMTGACQLRVGAVAMSLYELPPAKFVAELARLMDR
jgi:hypothetical protein